MVRADDCNKPVDVLVEFLVDARFVAGVNRYDTRGKVEGTCYGDRILTHRAPVKPEPKS